MNSEIVITNATRKLVKSLGQGRHRRREGLFVAEGTKCVVDTAAAFECRMLLATRAWLDEHADFAAGRPVAVATRADMERMTQLATAPEVIAVYAIPEPVQLTPETLRGELVVALDRIQDPGNLGTIVRVCDWMGVRHIIASEDTVDIFNPKVVQATMGSLSRVSVWYTDLPAALNSMAAAGVPIFGTLLDAGAENIYTARLPQEAVLVMGNEGSGLSEAVRAMVTRRIYIPPYPADADTAESLNVAVATSIALAQFRRTAFTHNS